MKTEQWIYLWKPVSLPASLLFHLGKKKGPNVFCFLAECFSESVEVIGLINHLLPIVLFYLFIHSPPRHYKMSVLDVCIPCSICTFNCHLRFFDPLPRCENFLPCESATHWSPEQAMRWVVSWSILKNYVLWGKILSCEYLKFQL
jgi:hypothetical protein